MRIRSLLVLLFAVAVAACGTASTPTNGAARRSATLAASPVPTSAVLGRAPLCEASGARVVRLGAGEAQHKWLVLVDNEEKARVFAFPIDSDGALGEQIDLPLAARGHAQLRLKDLESMEVVARSLLVVGSHSRRGFKPGEGCPRDESRLVLASIELPRGDATSLSQGALRAVPFKTKLDTWTARITQSKRCRRELFALPASDPQGEALAAGICERIAAVERDADAGDADACANAFNVEGVVAIHSGADKDKFWVGLRAPLVGGKAVLARLAAQGHLRFDAVALVDLDGDGIRELAFADGRLFAISGTVADSEQPGALWELSVADLQSGRVAVGATKLTELPPHAEGLALDGDAAWIVVDGERGKGETQVCAVPAGVERVALPRP